MLLRVVASVFFEEHRPQKLPIHGLYAGVARDSCLPCKCYWRAASRAAACRAPVALLVASRVNVPLSCDTDLTLNAEIWFCHKISEICPIIICSSWCSVAKKTFMVHQTFVWWALYILFKFVKSFIRHLGLAIGNVQWFSWTLLMKFWEGSW